MAESNEKFSLSLEMDIDHREEWAGLTLSPWDLVRGVNNKARLTVINKSGESFPGCLLSMAMEEHGPSPNESPLKWVRRDAIKISELEASESVEISLNFYPLINGLFIVRFQIDATTDTVSVENVELNGFRSTDDREVEFVLFAIPNEHIQLNQRLKDFEERLGGK